MLAIRMQRTGRKGHAQFRVVVQDSRQTPTSGKFVAHVGNYDPHTKTANLVKDKIEFYMKHGAQPSERAALLFKKEGIKLPKWVEIDTKKQGKTRNPDKFQKDKPQEAPAEESAKAEETFADDAKIEPETKSEAPEAENTVVEEEKSEPEAPANEPEKEKVAETPTENPSESQAKEETSEETTGEEQPKVEPESKADKKAEEKPESKK